MGGQTDLLPVIVIGAVTGFVVSKAITPLLPKPHSKPTGNEGANQQQQNNFFSVGTESK